MTQTPSTEHDWTVHSINIHGVFFERWCQQIVTNSPPWRVRSTNYPVAYPPPAYGVKAGESALDIRAELAVNDRRLTLLIECKKNNPEFVNWVFFPRPSPVERLLLPKIENTVTRAGNTQWTVAATIASTLVQPSVRLADEARETRGSYQDYNRDRGRKTQTSNAAISDAAYQVALATQAIVEEETQSSDMLAKTSPTRRWSYQQQLFLPVVVTTAQLSTCSFDPVTIDPGTGEIPYAEAALTKCDYLVYEYPVPVHIQRRPPQWAAMLANPTGLSPDSPDSFVRMHILVVHSGAFAKALAELAKNETAIILGQHP